jgi:hypothetical protein
MVSPGEQLAGARSRWARNAPLQYSMTIRRGCECGTEAVGPVIVTVVNGAISAHYINTGSAVPKTFAPLFPDVEGLFNLIEAAQRQHYYKVDVEYDAELGFPKSISLDHDKQAIDDESFTIVSEFNTGFD